MRLCDSIDFLLSLFRVIVCMKKNSSKNFYTYPSSFTFNAMNEVEGLLDIDSLVQKELSVLFLS